MKITIDYQGNTYDCDLSQPLDISIPVGSVNCFYATPYDAKPLKAGSFVGEVRQGAPVNFFDVQMNPHGHGTHTECLGHITVNQESIYDILKDFHQVAYLVTIPLTTSDNGDLLLVKDSFLELLPNSIPSSLIIRTSPNSLSKRHRDYSGTNPPYLASDAMEYLVERGVEHLLLDLPSVDKEVDGGVLVNHHVFWGVKDKKSHDPKRTDATITELIFVPNEISDGLYLLNLQVASFMLDAAPSRPLLFSMKKSKKS